MKRKIMTIVGTRPEIIKLSRVIAELEQFTDHVLVHTGQNFDYELNEIFFNEMEIRKPDHFLDAVSGSTAETIGNIIAKSDAVMEKEEPDAVLLYGDTNSCLSVISAKRRKIPVFHMEAGNRCFDQRVPEEVNRKIVDHLSDINMTLTEHARRYLIQEGLKSETIIKTGSSMLEVLNYHRPQIEASDVLDRLGLKVRGFFVVSAHREENVDSPRNFKDFLDTMRSIRDHYGLRVIVSTHPRTRKKMEALGIEGLGANIEFMKPLGFLDYIKLQMNAYCVVSDSGTITEESSILGFPAITIRQAHERPEGMDEGILIMAGLEKESVLNAIDIVTAQAKESPNGFRIVPDYDVDNVSKKVVRIIVSYIDYINRTVWGKGL
ncbi:MAG: UDP-N-acetylglucosamine 2-epimerase (non-hydrolyzing) [Thermodesulfobacteriota bacterium]|nr:UDP-N-acetylglucosamine 2-epimerase (non-hydrolyzing) [Thermodesulfobacteriota bacterium]